MHAWERRRSAPLGALLAGAVVLLTTLGAGSWFYVSVVRSARGLPAFTAGVPRGTLARAPAGRAAYSVMLRGPSGRETPAGTASAAHRWRVAAPAAPDDPLCQGAAEDELSASDDSGGALPLRLPLPARMFARPRTGPVPPRLLAICPEAADAATRGGVEYLEEVVPDGTRVEVIGCVAAPAVRASGPEVVRAGAAGGEPAGAARAAPGEPRVLGACDDGAPSRIYPREAPTIARARVRAALARVAGLAAAFAVLCFAAGWLALRRFDRERRAAA